MAYMANMSTLTEFSKEEDNLGLAHELRGRFLTQKMVMVMVTLGPKSEGGSQGKVSMFLSPLQMLSGSPLVVLEEVGGQIVVVKEAERCREIQVRVLGQHPGVLVVEGV